MVKKWQMEHLRDPFTKSNFREVFKSTLNSVANLTNSVSAFKRSGLFPLTPAGIDQSKLGPSKMTNDCSLPTKCSSTSAPSPAAAGQGVLSHTPSVACLPPPLPVSSCIMCQEASLSIAPSPAHGVIPQTPSVACLPPQLLVSSQETSISIVPLTVCSDASNSIPVCTGPLASTSCHPSSVTSVLRLKSDNTFVSPAFNHLRVPQPKKSKNINTIRQCLPKALSGSEALKMLREKEEKKQREEQQKHERKEEGARKKREREEEKERKKQERQIAKKIKLLEKKRQRRSSDSDESDENIPFTGSSDEDMDVTCPACRSSEGRDDEWLGEGRVVHPGGILSALGGMIFLVKHLKI